MVQANCVVPIEFMTGLRDYRIEYYVTELPEAAQVNAAILEQYRALADATEPGPIKELFEYLANEETKHKQELEKLYYETVHSGGV